MNLRRRGFSGKKKPGNLTIVLQITSMVDVFSVILVFLLKSLAGGSLNLSPSKELQLPVASTQSRPKIALTVEISEKAIQIESKFAVALADYKFQRKDLLASGIPAVLHENFEKQRKRQNLISKSNSDVKRDSKILILADRMTPYITLKRVISSAAIHGFNEPKLIVVTRD